MFAHIVQYRASVTMIINTDMYMPLLYGGRIKVDLDTVVILSGFASLLYHGQISQKLVCLSDRLTSDTSL